MSDNKKEFVEGHRYLVKGIRFPDKIFEGVVVEISPSKKTIKLSYTNGQVLWQEAERLTIIEDLGVDKP